MGGRGNETWTQTGYSDTLLPVQLLPSPQIKNYFSPSFYYRPSELGHSSNQRLAAAENEALGQHHSSSADDSDHSDPWSPRTLPRRYTVGGPRSAGDVLAMQPHNVDRKREAFLEHLKQKYPHHASTIMGHQERVRDQVRTARSHSCSPSQ